MAITTMSIANLTMITLTITSNFTLVTKSLLNFEVILIDLKLQ